MFTSIASAERYAQQHGQYNPELHASTLEYDENRNIELERFDNLFTGFVVYVPEGFATSVEQLESYSDELCVLLGDNGKRYDNNLEILQAPISSVAVDASYDLQECLAFSSGDIAWLRKEANSIINKWYASKLY